MSESSKVVYRPQPGDPNTVVWRGIHFTAGQEITVEDADLIEAAKGNPHFDVDGQDKAAEREKHAADALRVEAEGQIAKIRAEGADMETRQTQETDALEAKHQAERDDFENRYNDAWNRAAKVLDPDAPASETAASPDDGGPKDAVQTPTPVEQPATPNPGAVAAAPGVGFQPTPPAPASGAQNPGAIDQASQAAALDGSTAAPAVAASQPATTPPPDNSVG